MARLRLFGPARMEAGVGDEYIPGGSVAAVLDEAAARFGERFAEIVSGSQIWVNGNPAGPADPVADRDEVAVIPPVSGG